MSEVSLDKPLALLLARINEYTYTHEVPGMALKDLGSPDVRVHEDTAPVPSSLAMVFRYSDKTVVAFRGTFGSMSAQGCRDWLANFVAALIPVDGVPGLVHAGFWDQLALIYEAVRQDLHGGYIEPLHLTGHSQGGAIANIATKVLQRDGINVATVHTFEAPRPGNGEFAASLGDNAFRIEYGDDIVPHVPHHVAPVLAPLTGNLSPSDLVKNPCLSGLEDEITTTLDYAHAGALTYRAPGSQLRTDMSTDEDKDLERQRLARLPVAGDNVFEHHHLRHNIEMFQS